MNLLAELSAAPLLLFAPALRRAKPAPLSHLRLRASRAGAGPSAPRRGAQPRLALERLLAALLADEGRDLALTLSPEGPLPDLALLAALDRRHAVTVRVPLAAVEEGTARRIEGPGLPPRERLAAVAALAGEGIETRVVCGPIRPGVNDGLALRRLVEAAYDAGAADVELAAARGGLLLLGSWLSKRRAIGLRDEFEALRLVYGFPRSSFSRS
jgi:hypothetical protein